MTIEQRLDQLEKRNKRLTVALTMMAVVMCAVVTMAATGDNIGTFHVVKARYIWVTNDAGDTVVALGANDGGDGLVTTLSAKGKDLVDLSSTAGGNGTVTTYQPNGKELVRLGATVDGNGTVKTYQPNGKPLVELGSSVGDEGVVKTYQPNGKQLVSLGVSDNGGLVYVFNKTGEFIAEMSADEYGNGLVGAWSRKGKGRTLQPGP
ncbi:hypothetical protein OAF45_02420 [Candidatus Latescibacteria bacterium]|nr:hypothetical protein [Candidatus Latescibacterota bacterium]